MKRFSIALILAFALLLVVAIPWYWPAGDRTVLWPGLPAWALAAYLTSFATSILTALVLPRLFADGEETDRERGRDSDSAPGRERPPA